MMGTSVTRHLDKAHIQVYCNVIREIASAVVATDDAYVRPRVYRLACFSLSIRTHRHTPRRKLAQDAAPSRPRGLGPHQAGAGVAPNRRTAAGSDPCDAVARAHRGQCGRA